jgi:uroporphyrinogen-III decarboxylase
MARDTSSPLPLSPGATYRTVFGVERTGMGYGQPMSHPLAAATLKEIHDYPWPDPEQMDVSQIRSEALAFGGQYAILGGDWSPFWHDLIDLLGMEGMYLKMYDEPELVDAVLQHMVDYYAAVSRRIFEAAAGAIDVFFFGNDLGSRQGPLLGEAMFRRFLLPHLARLIDLGHQYGLRVMMHCCGGFFELIPALIEIGLDGVQSVQPSCRGMDLRRLKARFGDKILFNGAIDSHHVLIRGTPASIRQSTREVLTVMMPGGGYVASASHDTILEETPVENVLAMFDAIAEFGRYDDQ